MYTFGYSETTQKHLRHLHVQAVSYNVAPKQDMNEHEHKLNFVNLALIHIRV